jgi:hypothetical protein
MAGVTFSVNKYRNLGKEMQREGRIVLVFPEQRKNRDPLGADLHASIVVRWNGIYWVTRSQTDGSERARSYGRAQRSQQQQHARGRAVASF